MTLRIALPDVTLDADLGMPDRARGLVIFVHGSGSSRRSSRNRAVAATLQQRGFGTPQPKQLVIVPAGRRLVRPSLHSRDARFAAGATLIEVNADPARRHDTFNMKPYSKIFVIADSHLPCSAAVRRGAQLALQCDAELTIALFEHDATIEHAAQRGAGPREVFIVERRRWLHDRVAPFLDPAIRLRVEAVWAPVRRDAILAAVLTEKPDLVLKDIGHESSLKRLVATPLDWELLRCVPAALMLVQPHAPQLPRRVLAAVDTRLDAAPHPLNERILEAARRIAACGEARVDLAHAFPHKPEHHGEAEDRETFSDFAREHAVPLERRHWVIGNPEHEIRRMAGLVHANLIVLGSLYRSKLERFSLGTTAEALIQHSAQDVLLVKPDGFKEELARHLDLEDLQRRFLAAA